MLTDVGGAAGALFSPTTERETIIEWIRGANRWQHYQLFEMAAAVYSDTLPLDMLPLTDGPERVFARVRAVRPPLDWPADDIDRIWDAYLDRGFDSATADFARTVQAKWYAPGRAVTFTAAATFNTASQIVQRGRVNFERQLIHSESSRVPRAVAATPDMQFVEMSNIVLADIFVRALQEFGARREILQGARIDDEMQEIVAQNDDATSDTASVADDVVENTDESEFDSASDSGGSGDTDTETDIDEDAETDIVEDSELLPTQIMRHGAPFVLRSVQLQMFDVLRRHHFSGRLRFETPPGSGKTTFLAWLAATQLADNPEFRCVFFVPTKSIAHDVAATFTDFGLPCTLLHSSYKCPQLDRARVVVCCYGSALRLAGQQFTHVYVDEAHHLENVELRAAPAIRPYLHAIADMLAELRIEISATFRTRNLDLCVDHNTAVTEQIVLPLRYIVPQYNGADRMSAVANYLVANTHIHRRVLAYCNTEREALRFAEVALRAGLLAETIFGSTSMRRRAELLEQFVDGRARVLVSVGTLCEGVDIRAANTCVFVEARSSRINVWQCIGRVMRVHEGKQWGWVILPTTSESAELRRFADIIRVHDPTAFERGKPGRRIEAVCGEWRADENFDGTCEYETLEAALCGEWWQKLSWLREYVAAEQCLPVRSTTWTRPADGREWKMGSWISDQRQNRKKGKLSEDQIQQLETVPGWIWEDEKRKNVAKVQPWPEWLGVLREYVAAEECLPNRSTIWTRADGSEWKIGVWINKQRAARKKGKLSEDRVRGLGTIPGWFWEDEKMKNAAKVQPWPEWLEVLREYVAAEERLPTEKTIWTRPADGQKWKIGIWISSQRQARKKGKLSEDRIQELETIPGWFWESEKMKNMAKVQPWPEWLEVLREYVAAEGCLPSQKTIWVRPVDGSKWKIGSWIDKQRQNCKNGKLLEDRVRELETVPGWFWEDEKKKNVAKAQPWMEWLGVLREYAAAEGCLPVRSTVWTRPADGQKWKIGDWISAQRQNRKKGKLSEDQIQELETIPGWIWEDKKKKNMAKVQPWPEWLEVLREYIAAEGCLPVQSTIWTRPTDRQKWKIGNWIKGQRTNRKNGKLLEDRARELETIPGWKW
jgi:superfamily II DNA or RNA helicase